MDIYYTISFFIFGTLFGSFFGVIGSRLPLGESIIYPSSHCTNCGHFLRPYELIPIFSFLFQKGKCTKCKTKLSWKYPLYELATGILFSLCYVLFKFTWPLIIGITFVSAIMIIVISDIEYYIIPDEVIVFSSILLLIELFLIHGWKASLLHLLSGTCSFILMYGVKCLGDFAFKKESMGGGDIKLMFLIGLVIGFPMSIITIFLSSFIGLPISLFILFYKKTNIIPFGPFLGIAAILILFTQFDFTMFLSLLGA